MCKARGSSRDGTSVGDTVCQPAESKPRKSCPPGPPHPSQPLQSRLPSRSSFLSPALSPCSSPVMGTPLLWLAQVVNQLLSKIDGVNSLNNILVIGMTNRKDMIDEALLRPGRAPRWPLEAR